MFIAKGYNYVISNKQFSIVDSMLSSPGFQGKKKEGKGGIMRHKNTENFHAFSQFKSSVASQFQTDGSMFLPLKTFFGF